VGKGQQSFLLPPFLVSSLALPKSNYLHLKVQLIANECRNVTIVMAIYRFLQHWQALASDADMQYGRLEMDDTKNPTKSSLHHQDKSSMFNA
jgi:hypothetical protein